MNLVEKTLRSAKSPKYANENKLCNTVLVDNRVMISVDFIFQFFIYSCHNFLSSIHKNHSMLQKEYFTIKYIESTHDSEFQNQRISKQTNKKVSSKSDNFWGSFYYRFGPQISDSWTSIQFFSWISSDHFLNFNRVFLHRFAPSGLSLEFYKPRGCMLYLFEAIIFRLHLKNSFFFPG